MVWTNRKSCDVTALQSLLLGGRSAQRWMCRTLEEVADSLGGPIDEIACKHLLASLENDLPLCHQDEEAVFDVLGADAPADGLLAKCIGLAKAEHEIHELYFIELSEPLEDLSLGRKPESLSATGYLFRCFFEGVRRHLDWEDAVLLGEALESLSDSDVQVLEARFARNRSTVSRHLRLAT